MADPIEQVKKELLACARRAYAIGLQTGNGGNLSARPAGTEQVVIKGSGTSFGECTMDNLVTVNLDGEMIDGPGKPSREIRTHITLAIMAHRMGGVIIQHGNGLIFIPETDRFQPRIYQSHRSRNGLGIR